MKLASHTIRFGATVAAACLLSAASAGCSAAADDDSTSAEARAESKRFTLHAGVEGPKLAACAPNDRRCTLHAVDMTNAYWLGQVSTAIYKTQPIAEKPLSAFGAMTDGGLTKAGLQYREYVVFDDNLAKSTAIYIETTDGVGILAFRGTANDAGPMNLVTDATVAKQCDRSNTYCVHGGFQDSFNLLWDNPRYVPNTFCKAGVDNPRQPTATPKCEKVPAHDKVVVRVEMKEYLETRFKSANRPKALFITGHSLGGALATLALNQLLVMPNAPAAMAVYTYGTPRVGNDAFAQKVFEVTRARNIPYYRFVHRQDGVARTKMPGYAHLGRAVPGETTDGLDSFIHLVGPAERGAGKKGPLMTLGALDAEDPGSPMGDAIKDHDMSKYLPLLQTADVDTAK